MNDNIQSKSVTVEYTFKKRGGRVWWYYRFYGQYKWTRQLISFKDVPFIKANWGDFARV